MADLVVAGLVLAAGAGRRLGGRPKAALAYRGRPLVSHAVEVLRAGGCAPVVAVLGAGAVSVPSADSVVHNADWESGMGSSLRAGLAALPGAADAVVVSLVDMPGVTGEAVARLVSAYRAGAGLVAATYDGRRGHPVLFARAHWEGVAAIARGDAGARAYLAAHEGELQLLECADIANGEDVDTPEAAARWGVT